MYAILWALLVYDTPKVHPRISQEEKRFILSQCGDPTSKRREKASPRPKYGILIFCSAVPIFENFVDKLTNHLQK